MQKFTMAGNEIGVFKIPHMRIKPLVYVYLDMMEQTDFSDVTSVISLLDFLHETSLKIKYHEEIEETMVLDKLHTRLQWMNLTENPISNCHSDIDLLHKVISLIEVGLTMAKTSTGDFLTFRAELEARVQCFTSWFLQHLEEEEELFEPLLIKYFGWQELQEIEDCVMQEHCLHVFKSDEMNDSKPEPSLSAQEVNITNMPFLVMTEIFSYLDIPQLLKCAMVCKSWNEMAYEAPVWKQISAVKWAMKGKWVAIPSCCSTDYARPTEKFLAIGLVGEYNEDAFSNMEIPTIEPFCWPIAAEIRIFSGLVKHVLWRAGPLVTKLDLTSSCTLDDNLLDILLTQCPNVRHLNVSYSLLGGEAFSRIQNPGSCKNLQTLSLEGCKWIEDTSILSLLKHLQTTGSDEDGGTLITTTVRALCLEKEDSTSSRDDNLAGLLQYDLEMKYMEVPAGKKASGLTSLNLSGCSKLTDKTLEGLLEAKSVLCNLEHLDLSGCSLFTAPVLNRLVKCCPKLPPENLSYCNNIMDGPYCREANGCGNLGCEQRDCCIPPEL